MSQRVEVSIDDPGFADPIEAALDVESQTWHAGLGKFNPGEHTIYARARRDATTSDAMSSTLIVKPDHQVQWQVTPAGGSSEGAAWAEAPAGAEWAFGFDTTDYGAGAHSTTTGDRRRHC